MCIHCTQSVWKVITIPSFTFFFKLILLFDPQTLTLLSLNFVPPLAPPNSPPLQFRRAVGIRLLSGYRAAVTRILSVSPRRCVSPLSSSSRRCVSLFSFSLCRHASLPL
ncbi:hypothetical protein PIB30_005557 [Stylosanthes scabra]|uniref:Uncharacterized protein n=1 Tax=Stylosanthes scabra TaxID=79078 RepID=A0ABU6Q564_9FABA|nr:hypothetical protein [Stylosanthes scabra]